MKRALLNRKVISAAALACAAMLSAKAFAAQPILLDTGTGNFIANAGAWGFTFQVGSADLIVNQVGFVDMNSDGLQTTHGIGFFLLTDDGNFQTNTPVASDTVNAGTADVLDNGFRYNDVSAAITLLAGQTYSIVGATSGGAGGDDIRDVRPTRGYTDFNLAADIVASPATRFAKAGGTLATDSPSLHRGFNNSFVDDNVKVTAVSSTAWTGGSGSNFSSAGNWGGTLPSFTTEDSGIAFNATTPATVNNDITGADLRTVRFDAGSPAITVNGNAFTITGSIANNSSNTQTISTGQITTNQSYINANSGKVVVTSNINIPRSNLTLVGSNDITLSGNLTGTGALQQDGLGTVLLSGDNSAFTGSIILNSNTGTLGNVNPFTGKPAMIIATGPKSLGSSSATVATSVALTSPNTTNKSASSAVLQINGGGNYTQNLIIAGKDTWQPGQTTQYPQISSVGNNTWSGSITFTGASVNHVLESASGNFTISSPLQATNNSLHNLYFQGPGDFTLSGGISEVSGTVAITKIGGGTVKITNTSSWTQPTRVGQGTLELDYTSSATQRLGTGTLQMDGGTLKFTGNSTLSRGETVGTLQLNGFSVTAGIGDSSIVLNNGASGGTVGLTATAFTRGVGATLDVSGTGSLTVPAAMANQAFVSGYLTTGGGTSWAATNTAAQVIPFSAFTADGYGAGTNTDVTTSASLNGATTNSLRFNTASAATLTLSGTNTLTTGGILITPNVGANNITLDGSGTLVSGTGNELIVQQYNTAAPLVVNAQLFAGNTGTLTKSGPGGMVINSSNSFTGGTSINNGSILVTNANGLQNSNIAVWKNNGLVFQGLSAASVGMISGTGDLNIGAMDLTLDSTANVSGIYSGKLSGSGQLIYNSASTNTRLTGDNSGYTGDITINTGGLVVQIPTALGSTTGKTTVTATSLAGTAGNLGGSLIYRTAVDTNESITIAGRGFDNNTGALRIDNAAHVTFHQPIVINADDTQAVNPTTQTLISLGDDATAVFGGGITASAAHPNPNLYLFGGGQLGAAASGQSAGTNSHDGESATGSQAGESGQGTISGNISIGTGTLLVDGVFTLSGNNNVWNGLVASDFAILQIGDGGVDGSLGSGSIQLNQNLTGLQAPDSTINSGNLIFDRAGTLVVSNDISGSSEPSAQGSFGASVQLYGSGTIVFTGNDSYNGGLVIASGTAVASSDGNLGSSNGTISFISNGGTLLATGSLNSSGRPIFVGLGANGVINTNGFDSSVGTISGSTGAFHKAGAGNLTVNNFAIGTLAVDGGTMTIVQNGSTLATAAALSVANSAALDLNDNRLSITYSGASPRTALTALLKTGYNNGAWNGTSATSGAVVSSAAAANSGGAHPTAIGIAEGTDIGLTGTSVFMRYTYAGDANLDGKVDVNDFNALAADYNNASGYWATGDFNYDGKVNASDFDMIALNYGQALSSPALGTLVPEPTSAMALACIGGTFAMRRRRKI